MPLPPELQAHIQKTQAALQQHGKVLADLQRRIADVEADVAEISKTLAAGAGGEESEYASDEAEEGGDG